MVTIAEVFRRYGPAYREKYGDRMLPGHRRAMWAIEHCRTQVLGGHVYYCERCDETHYSYHSCRNRHCPQCQHDKGRAWLDQQGDLLLPTSYFLLTFTLPAELREMARQHQKLFYDVLFRASAAAMQKLALDPRFVGGKMGMVGVLHTWGRNLSYHPHVHYLVPGGGVGADGETWLPARKNFLLPVKALSKLFRAKFRDALRKTAYFSQIPASVWSQPWVAHCQPVGDGVGALKYLAPYIFRVAIGNNRILSLKDDRVTFRYQDTDTGQERLCTLTAEEFIRRFLQHVLPKGFVKVRYYGIFSPGWRKRLAALRCRLGGKSPQPATGGDDADNQEGMDGPTHAVRCPKCGRILIKRQRLPARGRCPP